MLTVNGRVAAVVDSPDSYQELLAARERIDALEGIRRGLASADRGDGRSAKVVLAKIRRKHRVPSSQPQRYRLAPESTELRREIRQLLHGKRSGRYRVLFEIRGTTVHVLHVRHGRRRWLA